MSNVHRIEVFLITEENDYQLAQAAAASDAARHLGMEIAISFARNDSIEQSQRILEQVLSKEGTKPDAIILQAVGRTSLPQVAHAAVDAGIGWGLLNQADYLGQLRKSPNAPVFCIVPDNLEIGHIEGQQLAALLPDGGTVLYIQGPSENVHASLRTVGLYEAKPSSVSVRAVRSPDWTEASAFETVTKWLQLSTSQKAQIDAVAAQSDVMAMGVRRAFEEFSGSAAVRRWTSLPFLGVDGLPKTGQAWVRDGLLTATIVQPPTAGRALEMAVQALRRGIPAPELTLVPVHSFPQVESLSPALSSRAAAGSK